ncbi:MAG: beta-galactosidase trimerization domain-containing protein [Candidatus Ratteibacteria bacterium]
MTFLKWLVSSWMLVASLFLPFTSRADCRLSKTIVDGIQHVIIENEHVRLTFLPSRGGVCTSFLQKSTGSEWTTPEPGGGIFGDRVWQQGSQSDWNDAPYECTVLISTPEKVSISLSGQGKTGDFLFDTFIKTVTLEKNSSAVHVLYRYEVGYNAMSAKSRGLWFHHAIGVFGKKMTYFYPLRNGVLSRTVDPLMPPGEFWEYNPVKGWMGAIAENGSGCAIRMEYRRLMCFYQWFGAKFSTLEWMFRNETINHGSSLSTEVLLIPFNGLSRIDGVGDGSVIALSVPDSASMGTAINVSSDIFIASAVRNAKVSWTWSRLPDGVPEEFAMEKVSVEEPRVVKSDMVFIPPKEGTYVVCLTVTDGDSILAKAEAPVVVGASQEKYEVTAEAARIGNPNDRFGVSEVQPETMEIPWRCDVETPHIKWAKPYFKGPVKALFLMHYVNAREILELAQRMDVEFDAPLIEYTTGPFYVGDAVGKQNTGIMNEIIRKYLKKGGYDCIVVAGLDFKVLESDVIVLLRKELEKGTGLVFLAPDPKNFRTLGDADFLPMNMERRPSTNPVVKWKSVRDHFIVQGIPIEALPKTGLIVYNDKDIHETGEVLLRGESGNSKSPLCVVFGDDGPRTVIFYYRTSMVFSGWGDCLTPYLRFPEERFPFQEYHLSLFYRAMVWASHKESNVLLTHRIAPSTVKYRDTPPSVDLKISGLTESLGNVELAVMVRNKEWKKVYEETFKADPRQENLLFSFSLPKNLAVGYYFLDTILRSQEEILNWGTTTFRVESETNISSFLLTEKKGFITGDRVKAVAEIANANPDMRVKILFIDSLGRELARKEQVISERGTISIPVEFLVRNPLATEGLIEISLLEANGTIIDSAVLDFLLIPDRYVARTWDDYETILWGSLGGYNQGYLIPTLAKLLKDAGISVLYPNAHWRDPSSLKVEHESSLRAGFKLMMIGAMPYGHNYPKGWDDDRKNYLKTGDPIYLERKPSLADPEYLSDLSKNVKDMAETLRVYYPLAWIWGDELSLIGRMPAFDYDFSPFALKEFRVWLRNEYGTLDALNREWRTAYRDWNEAIPLTSTEAVARSNFAPWSDHRTFMDHSYANFFLHLISEIEKALPESRTGLSGTQGPSAYNGYDWTVFSQIFTCMQPYYIQGIKNMLPAFNPRMPRARWNAGHGPEEKEHLWEAFLTGDVGTSFIGMRNIINPDYTLTHAGTTLSKTTEPFRKGLGKVWNKVTPDYDSIAILYSHRSIQGSYLLRREWWRNHQGWFQVLHDLGYSPKFISYQKLREGKVTSERYRVLILPYSVSISGEEVNAIEKFIRAGGTVLADIMTGALNGHCSIALPGMLDHLFGIARTEFNLSGPQGPILWQEGGESLDFSNFSFSTKLHEAIRLNGGVNLGEVAETPCFILNHVGLGATLYFNIDMAQYLNDRKNEAGNFYRSVIEKIIKWKGITGYSITGLSPAPRIYRHRDSENLYIGYLRPKDAKEWSFHFPGGPRHVYDILHRTYLGYLETVPSFSSNYPADCFALLPYRVENLAAIVQVPISRGKEAIVDILLEVSKGIPSYHAVQIEVFNPSGRIVEFYSGNFLLTNGKGRFTVPFALNDLPGIWKVVVTDIVSGVRTDAEILLQ